MAAVYVISNMTIRDRAEYDRYLRGFMSVFQNYDGEILAVMDAPKAIEGTWPFDRTVLLKFGSRAEATRWCESPEYKKIAVHRIKGTISNVVFLDGLD